MARLGLYCDKWCLYPSLTKVLAGASPGRDSEFSQLRPSPVGMPSPRSPHRPPRALPCASTPASSYLVLGGGRRGIYIHGNAQICPSIISVSATKDGCHRFETSCLKFKPHSGRFRGEWRKGQLPPRGNAGEVGGGRVPLLPVPSAVF